LGPYSRDGEENEQDDLYEEHGGQRDKGNKDLMEDGAADNIIEMLRGAKALEMGSEN